MKKGDYFKGEINNYLVVGRITTNYGDLDREDFRVVFDNDHVDENVEVDESFDFMDSAELDSVEDLTIITEKEYNKLVDHPLYAGFNSYLVKVIKGRSPELDSFVFGCGAIKVTRAQIIKLLNYLNLIKGYGEERELLAKIEYQDDGFSVEDIPEIKKLLEA